MSLENSVKPYIRITLIYILVPVFFYPIYFVVANLVDSLFGDQQLINWLYFGSGRILLKVFIKDWITAIPVMIAFFYLLILPAEYIAQKLKYHPVFVIMAISAVFTVVISYILGFRNTALIVNTLSAISFVVFYIFSLKMSKRMLL